MIIFLLLQSYVEYKTYIRRANPKLYQSNRFLNFIRVSLDWWNEVINQESYLNKYYYDIADIQIDGRCHCNGHASNCYGFDIN